MCYRLPVYSSVEHVAGFQDLAIAHKAVVDIWSVSPDVYMHLCL